ncbi:MAG TPA: hypothetical protein VMW91_08830, partial [Desulfosporosinus sp.]|nr:hypothetical protein [Desulfosporosinus sp.]
LLARRKALGNTLKHFLLFFPILQKPQHLSEAVNNARQEKLPYGISIALGTFLALLLPLGGGWS